MKKIIYFIGLVLCLILPINCKAQGSIKPSVSSINITQGSSANFTIKASNATGRIDISSSNSSIATTSISTKWLDNDSVTVSVKGISIGSTSILVRLSDAATYDSEVLGNTYTINVNVKEKVILPTLSSNKNIKNLSITGYELEKVDDNNYKLEVSNSVTSIEVLAETEDILSTISGTGEQQLNIGLNNIALVITAEDKSTNTINIVINRKDGYYLEDIDYVLKELDNAELIINQDTITKDILEKIKNSNKTVILDYYNNNKNNLYSFIIDGTKLDNITDFNTKLNFNSDIKNNILELSNYADGIIVSNDNNISGIKIKLNVSDKYNDSDTIYLYNYDNNKLVLKDSLTVNNGYIEYEAKDNNYILTKSVLNKKEFNIYFIISLVELILLIISFIAIIILLKKKKSNVVIS